MSGFDTYIEIVENGPPRGQLRTDVSLNTMWAEKQWALETGLLAPDEPTPYDYAVERRAWRAEFTPAERERIRLALWLEPTNNSKRRG